jgi:hypothetical protein
VKTALRKAAALLSAAVSFDKAPGGRLIQSLSRRPPRQTARRSGVNRRSTKGGLGGTSEASVMKCLMPGGIGRFPETIMGLHETARGSRYFRASASARLSSAFM